MNLKNPNQSYGVHPNQSYGVHPNQSDVVMHIGYNNGTLNFSR